MTHTHQQVSSFEQELTPDLPTSVSDLVRPYYLTAEDVSIEFNSLMQQVPFLEGDRFDGKKFKIFINSTNDPLSAPAKSFDATIRENDKNWQDSRDRTVQSLEQVQDNSFYFTYVDTTDEENPFVSGTLMVTDLSNGGKSETISYFKKKYPNAELPEEFQTDGNRALWDIVSIMTDIDSRNGITSAYLYRALYKAACETVGLDPVTGQPSDRMTWISSLSFAERKNLQKYLAAPFNPIDGVPPTYEEVPGGKPVEYTFCSLKIEEVYPKMGESIIERELTGKPMQQFIAKLARVVILGTANIEEKDVDPSIIKFTNAA